jgi:hydrogenase/urease accessory protein HupE
LVRGLLGTQTDLLLEVSTLDGRLHSTVLKPSRPGLIVPEPPSWISLAGESILAGMRRTVRYTELWVLVLVLTCLGFSRASGAMGIIAFAGAHAIGQWLAGRNGLLISSHLPPTFALLTALVPALGLVGREKKVRGWVKPLWLVALLLGAIAGGANPETVAIGGLSRTEQVAASVLFALGLAFGLVVVTITLLELRHVLQLIKQGRSIESIDRTLAYITAVVCIGLLVQRATIFVFLPTGMPRAPVELALLAAVLGAGAATVDGGGRRGSLLIPFSVFLGAGLALGLAGIPVPYGTLVVFGSLFLFGILLALGKPVRRILMLSLGAIAVLGHGWHTGQTLVENVSLPIASAVGAGVVAVGVFYASMRLTDPPQSEGVRKGARLLGALAAAVALSWRLGEYYRWLDVQVATEAALGFLRFPLLALLLLVAAAIAWPRRRRVLHELGIETRKSVTHWILVGLAFFLVPIGTVAASNPFFEPEAPRGDDARRVVSQVLWNTYNAFNLTDEDELYDRLSQSVTGDLVADLYLDSRRRLTAGTREGAEVTVRDVSVVEVDDSARGTDGEESFSYACRWIVTARVRHLQHVHHRQNIYNGNLTIRVDGDRWKIAQVELTSEDRVVLPWKPT